MTLSVPFMKKRIPEKLFLMTGFAGYIFILLLTLFHRQAPLFDEAFFVKNFALYEQHGLSPEFLVGMQDQAPGPLYEIVHFAFKPLTNLTTPGIRLVNVFLLGLTMVLMAKIISFYTRKSFVESLNFAVALIAVPMVWQVTGMALTEMPTMFFSMLSVFLLLLATRNEKSLIKASLFSILAGIAFGLSVLGRSPFLTLCIASSALLLGNFKSAARWRTLVLYSICGLSIAVPVFLAWDGLVPPQQTFIGRGFSLWHGILSFAYGGLLTLIIAPRWFYFTSRKTWLWLAAGYIILLALNLFLVRYEYFPLLKTMEKVFPPAFLRIYPLLISPLLATLSLYFIFSCLVRAWQRRSDPFFVFLLFCGMLLLASSLKVTHLFSTRYVAQASPFFVLLFPDYDSPTWGRWLRFILGMLIGFASLETYFNFN
jgi:hypothetical protein